jgi:hypothetical protein
MPPEPRVEPAQCHGDRHHHGHDDRRHDDDDGAAAVPMNDLDLRALQVNPDWTKLPLFDQKGWKRVRFEDGVCVLKEQVDPASGEVDRYVTGEPMETETSHIRRWGTVGDGYLGPAFIRRYREGQVLYGSRRTYLKKVAVAEWDGITANTTLVLEAVDDRLLQRLLPKLGNPKFTALGERLEKIKEHHEQGFLTSPEFLKAILEVACDVVEAERETDPEEERDRAKEALTELFTEARTSNTHIIVERIVADIDDIVKKVRFPDWQHTSQGERLVQKELRRTLLKYKLHTDQELFDKAYGYIRQYY